jgi:hypothetical protein
MARAVVHHSPATHEGFAIVSISPLPAQAMQFGAVQDVIFEFLEDHLRLDAREVQPLHLGQGLVHLGNAHDRDLLVENSPYQYGDVEFLFTRHNQGRNWRVLNFTRECWLMLMDFPLDFWNHESIQNAVASFGKVILWENVRSFLTRLLVRARVIELVDVPHFIVLIDTQGSQSQSWTIQCEILQQHLLEVLPQDEEPVPSPLDNGQPPMFEFCGLGLPGAGPFHHHEPENEDHELVGWGDWVQQNPDAALAALQDDDQFIQIDNINQVPVTDLNMVPFAEMEELADEVDQLVVVPDLNFAPIDG